MGEPLAQAIKVKVNHRRRVEREQLAEQQPADDGDSERPPQFRSGPGPQGKRQASEQRRHGGHHDGPEPEQAGFINRVSRILAAFALGFEGEVDHHNGVLLDDSYQEDDADQGNHAQLGAADQERQDGADTGRWKRREYSDGMYVAFVQDPQHDVNGDQGGQYQERLVGQRRLESQGRALETRLYRS